MYLNYRCYKITPSIVEEMASQLKLWPHKESDHRNTDRVLCKLGKGYINFIDTNKKIIWMKT